MPVKDTLKGLKGLIFNSDEEEDEEEEVEGESEGEKSYQEVSNRNLNMKEADMLLFDPRSFEECTMIAKHLTKDKVCIVNIRRLNEGAAQRLLDFLAGVIFALNGTVEQVDDSVIVYAPKKTKIAGNIGDED